MNLNEQLPIIKAGFLKQGLSDRMRQFNPLPFYFLTFLTQISCPPSGS